MLIHENYVPLFKALSDVTRLKIIDLLSDGEYCACELLTAFNITQPTLSYHMKILSESGLVVSVRKGAWTRYSLSPERIDELKAFIDKLMLAPSSLGPIERSNC